MVKKLTTKKWRLKLMSKPGGLMLKITTLPCAALFLLASNVQQSSAHDLRYFAPSSTTNLVQVSARWRNRPQPRRRVPQAFSDTGRSIGTFAGQQFVGRKVQKYIPWAGKALRGTPAGSAGMMLIWPDRAE
jgi:hypothetical protein